MATKLGDLLAIGLLFISIWVLTIIFQFWITLGQFVGVVGAVITIMVELVFIFQTYKRRK